MVVGFHIGTDGGDQAAVYRGPGGAILNYVETTYGGQKVANMMVSGGALDRHPELKVLVSEGGATWVPFLGDRMNEAYRQHGMFVRPQLSRLPKEILYRQVYASFQHDESAPAAMWAMGYQNVLFGQRLPAPRGHLRPHPEDAARAVRRRRARRARAHHPRHVRGTLSPRFLTARLSRQPNHRRPAGRAAARRTRECHGRAAVLSDGGASASRRGAKRRGCDGTNRKRPFR